MIDPINPPAIIEVSVVHVENLAKRKIASYKELTAEIRTKQEMLRDELRNDSSYSEIEQQIKEAQNRLKARKATLSSTNDAVKSLSNSITELKEQKTEDQLSLFDTLDTYRQHTGSSIIELDNGDEYKIKRNYKVERKA